MSKFNKGWLCCAFLLPSGYMWQTIKNYCLQVLKQLCFGHVSLWPFFLLTVYRTGFGSCQCFFFSYKIFFFFCIAPWNMILILPWSFVNISHYFLLFQETKQKSQSQHSHPWPMLENLSNYLKGQVLFLHPKKHCNWQTVVFPFMQIKLLQPCQWGFGEPLLDYCM